MNFDCLIVYLYIFNKDLTFFELLQSKHFCISIGTLLLNYLKTSQNIKHFVDNAEARNISTWLHQSGLFHQYS